MACLLVLTMSVVDRLVANVETGPPRLKTTIPAAIIFLKLFVIILYLLTIYIFLFCIFYVRFKYDHLFVSYKLIITEKIATV